MLNWTGIVDDFKEHIASVVANQLCNTFASDDAHDLGDTWRGTCDGEAVSPDNITVNWDVASPAGVMPT